MKYLMLALFFTGCGTDLSYEIPKAPEIPKSCSVTAIPVSAALPFGGSTIQCGTDPAVTVVNGGAGTTTVITNTVSFNSVQIIEPCTHASSPYKEVLLGLANGMILSEFSGSSSATTTRFIFLDPGTYTDTDASGCVFTVTATGITWAGGTNAYATWVSGGYTWNATDGWHAL